MHHREPQALGLPMRRRAADTCYRPATAQGPAPAAAVLRSLSRNADRLTPHTAFVKGRSERLALPLHVRVWSPATA
jgi:hypothetical protein